MCASTPPLVRESAGLPQRTNGRRGTSSRSPLASSSVVRDISREYDDAPQDRAGARTATGAHGHTDAGPAPAANTDANTPFGASPAGAASGGTEANFYDTEANATAPDVIDADGRRLREVLEAMKAQINNFFAGQAASDYPYSAQLDALHHVETVEQLAEGQLIERQLAEAARDQLERHRSADRVKIGQLESEILAYISNIQRKQMHSNARESWFASKLAGLNEKLQSTEARAVNAERIVHMKDEEMRNVRDEMSKLESDRSLLHNELIRQRDLVAESDGKINTLKQQVQALQTSKRQIEENVRKEEAAFRDAMITHAQEIRTLESQNQSRIASMRAHVHRQEQVSKSVEQQLEGKRKELEQKLATEMRDKSSLESLLAQANSKNETLTSRSTELEHQVKQLEADNIKSTTDVAWLREDLQAARERNVAFEKQVQALQPETQRLQGRIRDLEDTEESLRRELDCASTDADTYLEELGDERRHCHALRAKHKCRLQEEAEVHCCELDGLRAAHGQRLEQLQRQHQANLNDSSQQIFEARREGDAARNLATHVRNEYNHLRNQLKDAEHARDLAMARLSRLEPQP